MLFVFVEKLFRLVVEGWIEGTKLFGKYEHPLSGFLGAEILPIEVGIEKFVALALKLHPLTGRFNGTHEVIDLAVRKSPYNIEVLTSQIRKNGDILLKALAELFQHMGDGLTEPRQSLAIGEGKVVVGLSTPHLSLMTVFELGS